MSAVSANPGHLSPDELMDAALKLPERARAQLASALLRSLDPPEDDPKVVRTEWKNELARRIDEIRSGKVNAVDVHESLRRMREKLREKYGV